MDSSHHSSSVALCPTPPDINFGTVVVTGNSIGDTATYTCDSGYELIGDAVRTCAKLPNDTSMADFQPEEPFCHRESCMNTTEWPWFLICVNHTRVLKAKSARIIVNLQHSTTTVYHTNRVLSLILCMQAGSM